MRRNVYAPPVIPGAGPAKPAGKALWRRRRWSAGRDRGAVDRAGGQKVALIYGPPGPVPPGHPLRMHTKVSFGIIVCWPNSPRTGGPEALLVHRRYTYEYAELVHGHCGRRGIPIVENLLSRMPLEEKIDLYSLDFAQMWYRIWLSAERGELFRKKQAMFQASWLRDDGGALLRRLINASCNGAGAAPMSRWDYPKGRRRATHESDVYCAIREVEEETGLKKTDYRLIPGVRKQTSHVFLGVRYIAVYYVAVAHERVDPKIRIGLVEQIAEVSAAQWMDIEQIRLVDNSSRRLEVTVAPVFRYVKRYIRGIHGRGAPHGLRGGAFAPSPADVEENLRAVVGRAMDERERGRKANKGGGKARGPRAKTRGRPDGREKPPDDVVDNSTETNTDGSAGGAVPGGDGGAESVPERRARSRAPFARGPREGGARRGFRRPFPGRAGGAGDG